MASNSEWKEDNQLKNDLRKYVSQNFKRSEILDFVQRDFPEYTWSTATLDRRVRHFGVYYKQLLDEVFVISGIIKAEVSVISRSRRLRLITLTETLIIPDITKTSSNNCFYYIDTGVLLKNIPLVKFIKTTSGTRVVYFP